MASVPNPSSPEIRPNAVYTLKEACVVLSVSEVTLRRAIKAGQLPSRRIGRAYRFLGSHLLAALSGEVQR